MLHWCGNTAPDRAGNLVVSLQWRVAVTIPQIWKCGDEVENGLVNLWRAGKVAGLRGSEALLGRAHLHMPVGTRRKKARRLARLER